MKKVISILMIAAFFVQSTSQAWVWIAFKINQSYIATNLCINRFEAIPVCKGSCYLEKQLDEDQKQQQKFPDLKTKEINLFCQDNIPKLPRQIAYADCPNSYPFLDTAVSTSDFLLSIFHPPDQAA